MLPGGLTVADHQPPPAAGGRPGSPWGRFSCGDPLLPALPDPAGGSLSVRCSVRLSITLPSTSVPLRLSTCYSLLLGSRSASVPQAAGAQASGFPFSARNCLWHPRLHFTWSQTRKQDRAKLLGNFKSESALHSPACVPHDPASGQLLPAGIPAGGALPSPCPTQ